MLSILIPIYHCDVRPLVGALYAQAQRLEIPWEIRLLDDASDASTQAANQPLGLWEGVHYSQLTENVGRARIRNQLAQAAQYAYLLFMDSDSGVVSDTYLQEYVSLLAPNRLISGGRIYRPTPPSDATYLHWYYGTHRECTPANVRNERPHFGFQTNNFIFPKRLWESFPFDESIRQYGHEDTLMGALLERAGIPILHIDNPLLHLELQDAETWWHKQVLALTNLFHLHQSQGVSTKATKAWRLLHRWGVLWVAYPMLAPLMPRWQTDLITRRPPRLRLFDAWKVLMLEQLWRMRGEKA